LGWTVEECGGNKISSMLCDITIFIPEPVLCGVVTVRLRTVAVFATRGLDVLKSCRLTQGVQLWNRAAIILLKTSIAFGLTYRNLMD
jgi:hypothetical protein